MSKFVLWLGLFFILGLPVLLGAVGLPSTNIWAILGALLMLIGLIWYGVDFRRPVQR